jgi:hypothetical protein
MENLFIIFFSFFFVFFSSSFSCSGTGLVNVVQHVPLCQHYIFWITSQVFTSIYVCLTENKMLDARQTLAIVREASVQLSNSLLNKLWP